METITVEAYKKMQAEGQDHFLIDVRTPEEFAEGHIEGGVNVPVTIVDVKIGDVVSDKGARVITYCRSGGRSSVAAKMLTDMGYKNVYSLEGGFLEYSA